MTPIPMQDTAIAHAGDPIFVRVVDLDRNRDGNVVETVDVRVSARATGDSEVLRLSETGPNTGVFVGYIATAHQRRVGRLRAAGRAQRRARCHLRGPDGRQRRGAGRRAGRSVRPRVRFADRSRRSTARACASSTRHRPAGDGVRRRRREPLPERDGHRPDGDRPGRHAVQHAGRRVPLPAGRAGHLSPRSAAAGQLRIPLAAHDRRSADAAERAVPPAAGFLRPELHRRGRAGRGRRPAARRQRERAGAAQDRRSADRDHRRLRAVHAHAAEQQRVRRVQQRADRRPPARPARAIAPGSLRLDGMRIADPAVAADGTSFTYTQPQPRPRVRPSRLRYVLEYTVAMRGRRTRSTPRRRSRRATCARTRRARWCA